MAFLLESVNKDGGNTPSFPNKETLNSYQMMTSPEIIVGNGHNYSIQKTNKAGKKAIACLLAALFVSIVCVGKLLSYSHSSTLFHSSSVSDNNDSLQTLSDVTEYIPATTAVIEMPSNASDATYTEGEHWDAKDQVQSSVYEDEPLSKVAPSDINIPNYHDRPEMSRPKQVFGSVQRGAAIGHPLPTNEWFLNLLVGLQDDDDEHFVGFENRVYTLPYIVDTVGSIVGIRLHFPHMLSWGTGVQSSFVDRHGLTLGTADAGFTRRYTVDKETLPDKLGVGIRWENKKGPKDVHMRSSIIRGMPYGTMQYAPGVIPAIASEILLASPPLIDSNLLMSCGTLDFNTTNIRTNSTGADRIQVKNDIELHFAESDFTWLVFFSHPVYVECFVNPRKTKDSVSHPPGEVVEMANTENQNAFLLRVVSVANEDEQQPLVAPKQPLIVRIALGNNCTTGLNVQYCENNIKRDKQEYMRLLREHSNIYPGTPSVSYAYSSPVRFKAEPKTSYIYFDWSPRSMTRDALEYKMSVNESSDISTEEGIWFAPQSSVLGLSNEKKELLMYALPHHTDILRPLPDISSNTVLEHCVQSLHGNACLVSGGKWAMEEDLDGPPNFMANRQPDHRAIAALSKALLDDIHYSIPKYFQKGSGDTYFSGKMLAKLGRIIVIASELKGLAATPNFDAFDLNTTEGLELMKVVQECKRVKLPTQAEIDSAIGRLRSGVEVWLNGTAQARLVYDTTWGGIVSCGCHFNGKTQKCDNNYPDCPTFSDAGLNFGNGFYNDHHFHYGYHISAAAVVANYDLDWGRKYFESVLLLIRDIANPSIKDTYFPSFRQKDWFLGNSWASGIATNGGRPYMNGRNQESSSEAIAAYEAVAMYGAVMVDAWGGGKSQDTMDTQNAYTAARVRDVGRLLTASELRSADRYWHVWHGNNRRSVYPASYEPPCVGMMWDTMVQFQTWFGNSPFLACGIQLLPLTPVSERRDNEQWARQLYPSFSESCEEHTDCTNQGWSILQYAILATVGHKQLALEKLLKIPKEAFDSAGGSGHSLSNSIWYISTRPNTVPLDLENPSTTIDSEATPSTASQLSCGCPNSCTNAVLSSDASGASCQNRIQWLMTNRGSTELAACKQVGGEEFPLICGKCNPNVCAATTKEGVATDQEKTGNGTKPISIQCPPCTKDLCRNEELNRCQLHTAPFVCHSGPSKGGCSAVPWEISKSSDGFCFGCCELFAGCEN